ncbi:type II secretion system protein N [uncultured Victivallis sp.]|uniref:type II secretion system protein N n=1 Tax=uncultured Victivallis sp. TaxID=354118 RepID=UPI002595451D|nr:type II secretion system protein N [uncultured Victivallis sp.]
MTIKQYNLIGITLGILAFALLGASLIGSPSHRKALSSPAMSDKQSLPTTPPISRRVKEDFSTIAANNLFHPQRGKATPEKGKEAAQKNKQTILKFELKGIYHSDNRHGALIVYRGNSKTAANTDLKKADADLFFQGKEISDGYILKEVRNRSVVIMRGNEKIEVELTMLQGPEKSPKASGAKQTTPPVVKK